MVKYFYGMYQAKPHDFSKKSPAVAVDNSTAVAVETELENQRKYPTKWTEAMVELRFEEAVATLKKLPDVKVQGYFNLWPQMKYSPNEVMQQEVIGRKLRASPSEISRLEQVIEWASWLDQREREVIWKRAMDLSWKAIYHQLGYCRTTAYNAQKSGFKKITRRLNLEGRFIKKLGG